MAAFDVTTIQTIKDQCAAQLAEITLNPKPTYTVGGKNVLWTYHVQELKKTIDWCNEQLKELDESRDIQETDVEG